MAKLYLTSFIHCFIFDKLIDNVCNVNKIIATDCMNYYFFPSFVYVMLHAMQFKLTQMQAERKKVI